MKGKDVYMAGPISGQSYKGATDWRETVAKSLREDGIRAFSPMRAKEYLSAMQKLVGHPDAYLGLGLSNPKGITTRDRDDCTKVDLVFANLLPAEENDKISIGTMIELGWADAARVPIVVVMSEDNPHQHAMVVEVAGYVVPTLEEGILMTKAFLLDDPDVDLSDLHVQIPDRLLGEAADKLAEANGAVHK